MITFNIIFTVITKNIIYLNNLIGISSFDIMIYTLTKNDNITNNDDKSSKNDKNDENDFGPFLNLSKHVLPL